MEKENRLVHPLRHSKILFQVILEFHSYFTEKILHPSITQALQQKVCVSRSR